MATTLSSQHHPKHIPLLTTSLYAHPDFSQHHAKHIQISLNHEKNVCQHHAKHTQITSLTSWQAHHSFPNKQTYPQSPQDDERNEFNEVPWLIVVNIKHDQVIIAEWVDGAEDEGSGQGTEKRPP